MVKSLVGVLATYTGRCKIIVNDGSAIISRFFRVLTQQGKHSGTVIGPAPSIETVSVSTAQTTSKIERALVKSTGKSSNEAVAGAFLNFNAQSPLRGPVSSVRLPTNSIACRKGLSYKKKLALSKIQDE